MNETQVKVRTAKRRLNANQPLTGDVLDFVLGLLPGQIGSKYDELWADVARKLKAGEQLGGYEQHLLCDVVLVHVRLHEANKEREARERPAP
jgi:hypothetical protein